MSDKSAEFTWGDGVNVLVVLVMIWLLIRALFKLDAATQWFELVKQAVLVATWACTVNRGLKRL